MRKIKIMLVGLLLCLFLPQVKALSYDVGTDVKTVNNNKYEIKVSLKDIGDTLLVVR